MAPSNNKIRMLVCVTFLALFSGYEGQLYDHFKLVQQWPPAFCKINTCDRVVRPINFTIHGLWPDNNGRQFLINCRRLTGAPEFVSINERNLIRRLDARWPDLLSPVTYGTNEQTFWKEEWDKHGTCSWNFFRQQKLYFEKAIVLKDKFDLLKILQENQINAGSTVDVHHVTRIISRATGGDPIVKCTTNRRAKTRKEAVQLTEIIICFNSNAASVIHCPRPNKKYNYGCTISDVYFPA